MRDRKTWNGITMKVYAGTTGVLLAFDVTAQRRKDLLGFAIRRRSGSNEWRWLRGLLHFPHADPPTFQPVDTNLGPVQKFRWSDYTVYPGTGYTYQVQGVYGNPNHLTYVDGPSVAIRTGSIDSGKHRIVFNRAVAASQSYTRRFGNTNPDEPRDSMYLQARNWLTRGMLQKVEDFMELATGNNDALELALFEFEYDGFVEKLKDLAAKGVKINVIYHGQPGAKQTVENELHLRPLNNNQKKPRMTTALFHQKFIVLRKKNSSGEFVSQAVLTGTANFTPNGLWRQANVIHIIHDSAIADKYHELFQQLLNSQGRTDTKKYINDKLPIPQNQDIAYSFSPRSGYVDIDLLEKTIQDADSEVLIRYGLQNSRTRITGTHRNKSFTVPAFLSQGLEGFLKESSKGQSGNIYIHLKTLITDFTTNDPTVIVGSHNFSKAASEKNDENFVIIKGDTDVADTYFCEMMRLYDHYRFRYNAKKRGLGRTSVFNLRTDNSWTDDYFDPTHLKFDERVRFCRK
jgi:hypothetical protein